MKYLVLATLFLLLTNTNLHANKYTFEWERLYSKIEMPKNSPKTAYNALQMALKAAQYHNQDRLLRIKWMMVVDFSQHSKNRRGYLLNLKTGAVQAMHVTHGENSGGAYATKFSNISNPRTESSKS